MASSLDKKINITIISEQAEKALARLQVEFKEFAEATEHFGQRFEAVSSASEHLMGKLERLGIASVFAEAGLFGLVNHVADVGYELGETAIKTGLSTQQLQYWQYAAKQSGIDGEELTNAFRFLSLAMGEARNVTSLQSQAFRYLHISLKDTHGQVKSTNELFLETMKALGGVHDRGLQARISMALYGRAFQDLLPLQKAISSGSQENIEDFRKYGYVLSEDAIKQSEEFHRSSLNLQTALSGLSQAVGVELLPVLQPLIKNMADYTAENRRALAQKTAKNITDIANAFKDAYKDMKPFIDGTADLVKNLGGLKTVILFLTGTYITSLAVSFIKLAEAVAVLNLALLANPFVFVAAAIALVGTAIYKLFQMIKPYAKEWEDFFSKLLKEAEQVAKVIEHIFSMMSHGQIKPIVAAISQNVQPIPITARSFSPNNFLAPPIGAVLNNSVPNKTNNQQPKPQTVNLHVTFDSNGRPQIAGITSDENVNLTANLGILR